MNNPVPASPVPTTIETTCTRGAWYLLEGFLQDTSKLPAAKVIAWAKAWSQIRNYNVRIINIGTIEAPEELDFELGLPPRENLEKDSPELQFRIRAFNLAHNQWSDELLAITLSERRRQLCRSAIEHAIEEKRCAMKATPGQRHNHVLSLLHAFGFVDKDSDE